MKKRFVIAGAVVACVAGLALSGCTQADTVSHNLSNDADSFKIHRDITVTNGITGNVVYQISGLCSLGNSDTGHKHEITCKIGKDTYVKEILWVGDQDQVLSVQTEATKSDPFAYEVIVKPTTLDLRLQVASDQ